MKFYNFLHQGPNRRLARTSIYLDRMNSLTVRFFLPAAITLIVISTCASSSADTVILKNGKKLKGLIITEYKDRVTLSTAEGEKTVMKSSIRSAIYDDEEKALLQKARNHLKRHQYMKAYYTYQKVLELDPELKEAKERVKHLRSFLEKKTREDIVEDLRGKNERLGASVSRSVKEKLAEGLGLVLGEGEKYVFVKEILDNALPGIVSSLKVKDRIVSVWGEMAAYMDAREVGQMILLPGEVKMTIERSVRPHLGSSAALFSRYRSIIGGKVGLKKKGITVMKVKPGGSFDSAGIKKGDILFSVDGRLTRYMPMEEFRNIVRENQNRDIDVSVRREVTFWKKDQ